MHHENRWTTVTDWCYLKYCRLISVKLLIVLPFSNFQIYIIILSVTFMFLECCNFKQILQLRYIKKRKSTSSPSLLFLVNLFVVLLFNILFHLVLYLPTIFIFSHSFSWHSCTYSSLFIYWCYWHVFFKSSFTKFCLLFRTVLICLHILTLTSVHMYFAHLITASVFTTFMNHTFQMVLISSFHPIGSI